MTTTIASFSFTGEFYTNHARALVLDGEWRKGYQYLMESFDGMDTDIAFMILKGTHALTGTGAHIDLENSIDENYQSELKDIYYWNVFSECDGKYKFSRLVTLRDIQDDIYERGLTYGIPEASVYVEKYIVNKNEVSFPVKISERETGYLIATKFDANNLPMWTSDSDIPRSARAYYELNIKKDQPVEVKVEKVQYEPKKQGPNIYRMAAAEQNAKAANFDSIQAYSDYYRQKVLDAIKEREIVWKTMNVDHEGKVFAIKYPYDLAMAYALQRTPLSALAPKWETVSEGGLKMESDSRLHTDLWLALGHNLDGSEYSYDEEHVAVFNHLMILLQENAFPAGEFYTLNSAGLKNFKGTIVTINSKKITKKDILVIEHAGPEFQEQAMKAGLVICEQGGKLAHLAIVGREIGLPLIRVDNACTLFKEGTVLNIDFETAQIIVN